MPFDLWFFSITISHISILFFRHHLIKIQNVMLFIGFSLSCVWCCEMTLLRFLPFLRFRRFLSFKWNMEGHKKFVFKMVGLILLVLKWNFWLKFWIVSIPLSFFGGRGIKACPFLFYRIFKKMGGFDPITPTPWP